MHQALSPLNRSNTMNINITLDIPTIISNAVTAERIQPIVDKAIGDAIKDAINDATGYRSEFREVLKKQIAEAMPHGIRLSDVAKFQHILNAALTNAVHGENAAAIKTALAKAVSSVMPEVPERIKLSELLEQARVRLPFRRPRLALARFPPADGRPPHMEGRGDLVQR